MTPAVSKPKPKAASSYRLDPGGDFIIEDYNNQKPFSNFFPGVAGLWGIPMWVFTVNRGQGIASFGIEGKDKAILEFYPANKAYRLTCLNGFRTFLKIRQGPKVVFWEPFRNPCGRDAGSARQSMRISSHDLTIEDVHPSLGLTVRVNYFTVPQESFPALVRHVTVINHSPGKYDIEMIDGLPVIMPFGLNDWVAKHMCRTVEAWVKVRRIKEKTPFYHLHVEVNDEPRVNYIHEGHFYVSFTPGKKKSRLLNVIVENAKVFGSTSDFCWPKRFFQKAPYALPDVQQTDNRMPSALTWHTFSVLPRRQEAMVSVVGYALDEGQMGKIVRRVTSTGFIEKKRDENRRIIDTIKRHVLTKSAEPAFDMYAAQTFLDNVLRGGLPITLKTAENHTGFNVFSRKHGDLERDYNYFTLAPTPFSQGNGSYRDVNQNRRCDIWINPRIKEEPLVDFLNLIQADGYNPLVIRGMSFAVEKDEDIENIVTACLKKDHAALREKLKNGFQPGDIIVFIRKENIGLKVTPQDFLSRVLAASRRQFIAQHGEGFWIDHWTYNLDLIENYLAIYPENLRPLLFEQKLFTFYHNAHTVLPRDKRYVLTPEGVRQYRSVIDESKEIPADERGNTLKTLSGEGDVYTTTLIAKLLCLIANKAATLDPSGIGIEMEADKPDWYDALNGLPGLIGSSLNETLELKRLSQFVLKALDPTVAGDIYVETFEELVDFIRELKSLLLEEQEPFVIWHGANDAKEHYRSRVRLGIVGHEHRMTAREIREFLNLVIGLTDKAVERAKDSKGFLSTYFYHEVTDYDLVKYPATRESIVRPKAFRRHALPLFLEGYVHALRAEPDPRCAQKIYERLKASDLYDRKLKMYKVNADLSRQPLQIGRTRIFPRGWLENESIWLHMEYKYLLELLRGGLYDIFFEIFKTVLVPFQDPAVYGRSILENSSFLVSSAHPDCALHGRGFVARLSGSTAELLNIWLWMNAGKNPFAWDVHQELSLTLTPVLPSWLFSEKPCELILEEGTKKSKTVTLPANTYAFHFLGSVLVVYHNPGRKDTYCGLGVREITLKYAGQRRVIRIRGGRIPAPHAEDVRAKRVERIDVYFE